MTTALIADDEPHLVKYLRDQLAALWPELEIVATARNGKEAAELITELQPDLAFLDIKMPGLSGIEVAQGIEGATRVVFVTAYDQFAIKAFEQDAIDYVLKPVNAERLQTTITRIQRHFKTAGNANSAPPASDEKMGALLQRLLAGEAWPAANPPLRWIRASQGEIAYQVDVNEVLYFQADDKYTCVLLPGAEHLIRTPISELARDLDNQAFWQIHRSTIVNVAKIASTRRDETGRLFVRVHGGKAELPVSRAYVHLFKAM
jgi:DNA-binding LytR/AlgR family response regulator